jgi:hypothetical protein
MATDSDRGEGNMVMFWCLNFDGGAGPLGGVPAEYVLDHGIRENLWLMQYQYRHAEDGHDYQQNERQIGAITRNWRAVRDIRPGDWCVAYLRPSPERRGRFYAVAEVTEPRVPLAHEDEVARTVRKRRHVHLDGTVGYVDAAGAFYEDFTEGWELRLNNPLCGACGMHPQRRDEVWKYPQRVAVKKWRHYVPGGVLLPGLSEAAPAGYRAAAFPTTEAFFDQIRDELVSRAVGD